MTFMNGTQSTLITTSQHSAMAPATSLEDANHRTLKRSFTAVTITPPSPDFTTATGTSWGQDRKSRQRVEGVSVVPIFSEHRTSSSKMPSTAGPRMYENHIPSFMSVYDMDASLLETPNLVPSSSRPSGYTQTTSQAGLQATPQVENDHDQTITQLHSHSHHESTSTQTSDSTDSSPTTTISTVDSSSLSDPSPSSSPESPVTLVPLSSFSGSTFGLDSFQSLNMTDSNPIRHPLSDERPMTSPLPRKPKNPKALALNLNPNIDAFQTSEPSSPSFIKPPPLKARKKPSLLSLNTGAANKLSLNIDLPASPGVPTMLQRRGLKHSISSPQILSTPGHGPIGGMTFGKPLGPSRFNQLSLSTTIDEDSHEAPTGVQMATRVPGMTVGGDSFDRPHTGEDAKSPSYPDGPILMHEPSVHLYLEPKMEEAMEFDVVINVAREVKNPFNVMDAKKAKESQKEPTQSFPTDNPISPDLEVPGTAMSAMTFQTAFEILPPSSTESSPTTPKPASENKRPEYIHVPWDHNTDVKDELWDLCELIESRTKEGKKVLVHCQQGASRSATLIIAYGMYINKDIGPTEAYSMAQAKSRWVNPNMSLLFSLNDFKKIIDRKKNEKVMPIRKPPTKHRSTLSANILDGPPTPSRARGNSTPSAAARDKALSSRPDDSPLPTQSAIDRLGAFDFGFGEISISNQRQERERSRERLPQPVIPPPPQRQAPEPPRAVSHEPMTMMNPEPELTTGHDLPRAVSSNFPRPVSSSWEDLMSPRLTEMTNNPLHPRNPGPAEDVPPTPGLFSPRAFEFPRSSFFPAPSASVAAPLEEDPRSPPTKGEAPIIRSIDDFL